jgi:hypothetical protein
MDGWIEDSLEVRVMKGSMYGHMACRIDSVLFRGRIKRYYGIEYIYLPITFIILLFFYYRTQYLQIGGNASGMYSEGA